MATRATGPLRWVARVFGSVLAALLLAAALALWWAGQTTSFVRWALARAESASQGALEVGDVRGTLVGGFGVATVRWRDDAREVELRDVSVVWRPDALLRRELRLARVEIGSATVRLLRQGGPLEFPATLALPMGVRVDAFGLGRLVIVPAGAEPLELERIAFAGRHAAGNYRIDHLSAHSPRWGSASLEGRLGDRAPFVLDATGSVDPKLPGWDALPRIGVVADGTLENVRLAGQAIAPAAPTGGTGAAQAPGPVWIVLDTRVHPLAETTAARLAPIELNFDGVEPAQFGLTGLPLARVSGAATIRVSDDGVAGRLDLRNALAGPADRQSVPVTAIVSDFEWAGQTLRLAGLRATLSGGGSVTGEAAIDFARRLSLFGRSLPPLKTKLALRDVDLSRLASGLEETRLSGEIRVDDAAIGLELADATRHGVSAALRARLDEPLLRVDEVRLGTPAGSVSARGTTSLEAPWRIDLSGEFRELDPAGLLALRAVLGRLAARADAQLAPEWVARLRGQLSGNWAAQGIAWPDPKLRTRVVIDRGVLDGKPLRADFRGEVSRRRIADAALELAFGDLQASADGALGSAGDRLQFTLRAASLARFDSRAEGSLSARGELAGGAGDLFDATSWQAFGVVADVDGRQLRWQDTLRIGALSGRIELPGLREGRVALRIDAEGLQVAGRPLDRARLRLDGDADAHALQLDASGPQVSARASARGALLSPAGANGWRWQGTVDEFVADAPVPIRLERPARLVADGDGIALGDAALQVDGGELRVATLALHGGRIETRGEASGLPIARWAERFAGPQALAGVEGRLQDVRLHGNWDLAGSSPQTPSGRVALRLDAGATIDSSGEAEVALDEGRLDGSIDLRVPTLAFANRLIGPEWAVAGRLRFAGAVGGTIAQPRLQGELTGRNLALLQRALGWRLTDGTLDARFDGDRLDLKMLRLQSGGGSIEMSGQLLLDGLHGGFTLRADRLPVPIGPGQRVVVSGNTGVASSGTSLEWKGDIRADSGLIELRGGEAPSMPDDVVIVDRRAAGGQSGPSTESTPSGFRIGADLNLDLGDKLRVRGSGIDVVLAGALNLRGTLPSAPRAFGTVRVLRGTYTAYGQRLEIERGQVVFNGPLDNPVLDIVAMRRDQVVEAGVALSGTVLSPRLRLVSTPDVPDSQKLSWLVLGVGLEDVNTAGQGAALQAAAATLFGSNDGGLSGGVAGALGLDILTVRGAGAGGVFDPNFGASFPGQATTGGAPVGTATQNVVAIGKRLSSRVILTYEQGLRGVWNLLRIQYDITNRLSIRAQTGTDSAVDVLYFWSFD